jgi:hypothetical protein
VGIVVASHREWVAVARGLHGSKREEQTNMSLDLATISSEARRRYIGLGRRYAHDDVVAQGHQTSGALAEYGPLVALNGFGAQDEQRLDDVMAMLAQRQSGRAQAVAHRNIISQSYDQTIEAGKLERLTVLALFEIVETEATEKRQIELAARVNAARSQTRRLSSDKQVLDHLSILHTAIKEPIVVAAITSRGGDEITRRLERAHNDLRDAQRDRVGHSPITSVAEERDILEGMVVTLARSAYAAAVATSRRLGKPSIAAAFRLTHLRRRSGAASTPEEP